MSDVVPADLVPSDGADSVVADIDPASVRAFLAQNNTELVAASPRSRSRAIAANIAAHGLHALVAAGGVAGAVVTIPQLPEHVVHGAAMGVTFVSGAYLGMRRRDASLRRGLQELETGTVASAPAELANDQPVDQCADSASRHHGNTLASVAIVGLFAALPLGAHKVAQTLQPGGLDHGNSGLSFICGIGGADADANEIDAP